jgi:hypothetical protein
MTTRDIRGKLEEQLTQGLTSEPQVVYVLVGIRKLIDRDEYCEKYPDLYFHCNWALHASMNRKPAQALLKVFDDAHAFFRDNNAAKILPHDLSREIDRISQMKTFEHDLSRFLVDYDLPPLTCVSPDGWTRFLFVYTQIIEDIPLEVSKPGDAAGLQFISHVVVNCERARETIKYGGAEHHVYKMTWTGHDRNGDARSIDIFNSYSTPLDEIQRDEETK